MQRRSFIKLVALGSLSSSLSVIAKTKSNIVVPDSAIADSLTTKKINPSKEYLQKIRNPDAFHSGDITAEQKEQELVKQLAGRLERVKNVVGYRNFSVLSFDDTLRYARNYSRIGRFNKTETEFLEKLFYEDAMHYGFYGEKPLTQITETIEKRSIVKVPYTGQFLFKGKPLELYKQVKKDIGKNIVLTSGVRGVVKQMHLFLRKASRYDGNLSLASRSLAPPGYSFHGVGDFDVGHVKLGAQNFTTAFAKTDEFKKLIDLGYIDIRYLQDNDLGVRYEPWHIKVS